MKRSKPCLFLAGGIVSLVLTAPFTGLAQAFADSAKTPYKSPTTISLRSSSRVRPTSSPPQTHLPFRKQ
jgi:hypothetical protein